MQPDPDVICMGDDIGILGGAFGVTEGLLDRHGRDRVFDMPISEPGIVGTSVGAGLNGKNVMVEMQFIDLTTGSMSGLC